MYRSTVWSTMVGTIVYESCPVLATTHLILLAASASVWGLTNRPHIAMKLRACRICIHLLSLGKSGRIKVLPVGLNVSTRPIFITNTPILEYSSHSYTHIHCTCGRMKESVQIGLSLLLGSANVTNCGTRGQQCKSRDVNGQCSSGLPNMEFRTPR